MIVIAGSTVIPADVINWIVPVFVVSWCWVKRR